MRVIFMGTPEFAVPSLKILVDNGVNVVGVVTSTDKYGGRGGNQLIESAVKKYALAENLHILQPSNLKSEAFLDELRSLKADLQIVVAFRMLPVVVWDMPPLGTYNLHGSLLPKYRGAAPIHWAVINGEKETGVTSFKLKHEIDTGDLLFQESIAIGEEETTGEVYEKLMHLGAKIVLQTVFAVQEGKIELKPQVAAQASKAPKINREVAEIDWHQEAEHVRNFVRGMNPFPGAWFNFSGYTMKVFKTSNIHVHHNIAPGRLISDNKNYLHVAVLDGFVALEDVQLQGKKRMDIKALLNGLDIIDYL
ncbi:methionyl-tRNA formyltransferase [Portibacter marinus]|uniref:methionyl-tRNA formyltransferase n=1 Tax=Portibacter marinus TaxID=2898660 RepID=UPI001F01A4AA|nr:methionyl-tRNA formyltransferase [Portibacter marinus]